MTVWRDNDALLAPVFRDSALLAEARPLSQDLAALAGAALEAMAWLEGGRKAPADWLQRQQAVLGRNAKARVELLLSPASALRKLIEAVR